MMQGNLTATTALKILMVASEYDLAALKRETMALIVRDAPNILRRKELRQVLTTWPWNLIDIVRSLVRGADHADLTDDDEADNNQESDDDAA